MTDENKNEHKCLDHLLIPIVVLNQKGEVVYYNHQFSTFTGIPPRKLKNHPHLTSLIESKDNFDLNHFLQWPKDDVTPQISPEVELITDTENNADPCYAVLKLIPLTHGKSILCFNNLSVERNLFNKYKLKIEELKKTHNQILQADKLATMGELTAGISHEISNPLTIALGNIEVLNMILETASLPAEGRSEIQSYINNVDDSLKRIKTIIEGMKEYLHKAEDSKEYHKLETIIEGALNLVRPFFKEKKVQVIKHIEDDSLVGHVNKIKMEQVLINLLKNALDAITENKVKDGKVEISLKLDRASNSILLNVADNGPGIKEEYRSELFTPFFTTKKVGDGLGLGLSISKKIVEAHHGELTVTNHHGACFTIRLPILENSSFTNNERYLTGISHKQDKKILVIDDDVQILNVMNKLLEQAGYVFIGSSNSDEALKFLEKFPADLIITDYEMPQANGSDFAKFLRSKGVQTPILYMTSAKNEKHFHHDKEKLQIADLIIKPFTGDDVIKSIKKHMHTGGKA